MKYKIQYEVQIDESIPKEEAIGILKSALYNQTVSGAMIIQRSVKVNTFETPQEAIDGIINDVCQRSGITKAKIFSRNRKKEIVAARFACMYLLRKEAFLTFKAIGRLFGRDHTTAIHALSSVENLLETNDELMVKNTGRELDYKTAIKMATENELRELQATIDEDRAERRLRGRR